MTILAIAFSGVVPLGMLADLDGVDAVTCDRAMDWLTEIEAELD